MAVQPVPSGYHTVTPYLVQSDAAAAIEFYKKAFGATEVMRMQAPGGKIGHAELKIGDSMIMMADEFPGSASRSPKSMGGTCAGVFLYVTDVDAMFQKAVDAGAKVEMPLANQFWGDRYGKLTDPFGHSWSMATHVEDVAPEEMKKRMKEAMSKMGQQTKTAT
jgi:PhnB protein